MMNKVKFGKFGKEVEGFGTPVLEEREIRAAAGILFLLMSVAQVQVLFKGNLLTIKYVVTVFLADLLIRVCINPRYSPFLIMGRFIVSRQIAEYTGAAQKKFAWKIGIGLAGTMFILIVLLNTYNIGTCVTCIACSCFLFFESAFGICIGCVVYNWFCKNKAQHCAGGSCD